MKIGFDHFVRVFQFRFFRRRFGRLDLLEQISQDHTVVFGCLEEFIRDNGFLICGFAFLIFLDGFPRPVSDGGAADTPDK